MTDVIRVEICAPERAKVEIEATEVICPGEDGIFAVRFGHTPLLTTLIPGVLLVQDTEGTERYFALGGGFAEVGPERTLLLADSFEESEHIDQDRARAAGERAEERLRLHDEDTDVRRAELALARSTARLKAAQKTGY